MADEELYDVRTSSPLVFSHLRLSLPHPNPFFPAFVLTFSRSPFSIASPFCRNLETISALTFLKAAALMTKTTATMIPTSNNSSCSNNNNNNNNNTTMMIMTTTWE